LIEAAMSRVPVRQIDITRAIRGAEAAGWPRGSFKVTIEGGAVTITPVNMEDDEDEDIARRMIAAFGE
jgi:hypothetical protein